MHTLVVGTEAGSQRAYKDLVPACDSTQQMAMHGDMICILGIVYC